MDLKQTTVGIYPPTLGIINSIRSEGHDDFLLRLLLAADQDTLQRARMYAEVHSYEELVIAVAKKYRAEHTILNHLEEDDPGIGDVEVPAVNTTITSTSDTEALTDGGSH